MLVITSAIRKMFIGCSHLPRAPMKLAEMLHFLPQLHPQPFCSRTFEVLIDSFRAELISLDVVKVSINFRKGKQIDKSIAEQLHFCHLKTLGLCQVLQSVCPDFNAIYDDENSHAICTTFTDVFPHLLPTSKLQHNKYSED